MWRGPSASLNMFCNIFSPLSLLLVGQLGNEKSEGFKINKIGKTIDPEVKYKYGFGFLKGITLIFIRKSKTFGSK